MSSWPFKQQQVMAVSMCMHTCVCVCVCVCVFACLCLRLSPTGAHQSMLLKGVWCRRLTFHMTRDSSRGRCCCWHSRVMRTRRCRQEPQGTTPLFARVAEEHSKPRLWGESPLLVVGICDGHVLVARDVREDSVVRCPHTVSWHWPRMAFREGSRFSKPHAQAC